MSEINCTNCAISDFKESLCERCDKMKRIGSADDIEKLIIRCLPSARSEQRWIPCSERLPEESGRYLVTRGLNACGALWNRVYIINYSDLMGLKSERIWWDGNVGKSDFERIDDVIAWMPLPEPYKGGQE